MNNMLTGVGNTLTNMATAKNSSYGTEENDLMDWLGYGSARRDREYQTYMSNTAYQRAVADMTEAGLNPGLMYSSGDAASTPNGGSAKSGQGIPIITSIASLLIGGAKMMNASKSASLDAQIAKETMKIAAKTTAKNNWYNRFK